jgi:hypothetical protein
MRPGRWLGRKRERRQKNKDGGQRIATFLACRFFRPSVKKTVVSVWKKLFGDGPDTDNSEADAPVDLDAFRTQFIEFQPLFPDIVNFLNEQKLKLSQMEAGAIAKEDN